MHFPFYDKSVTTKPYQKDWNTVFKPTISSKFSNFMIFPAVDFQFIMDLLSFYAGSKSNCMLHLGAKNHIIQFSPSAT